MHRIAKRVAAGAVALVVVAAALFMVSRLRGATPAQRAALEVMRSPQALPGKNAFAALWLLPYDVPEAQLEKVADEDVRRFAVRPPLGGGVQLPSFHSVAEGRFERLQPSAGERAAVCGDDCLAQVRKHPQRFAEAAREHAPVVERMALLSRYGHFHNRFELRLDVPLPHLMIPARTHVVHAVAFDQGRQHEALAGVCRDAGNWRRLMPNSDSLVVSMVAAGSYDRSLQLFADMLAELPAGQSLPDECGLAFAAPRPRESSLCTAMKGELAFTQATTRPVGDMAGGWLVFDREMSAAQVAHGMVGACTDAIAAPAHLLPADAHSPWWRSMMRFECVSNFAGCVLADISAPTYRDYARRAADHAIRLHAGAVLLRLHAQQSGSTSVSQETPASLRVDAGSQTLVLGLEARGGTQTQRLPLPSSRHGKATARNVTAAIGAAAPVATAGASLR